MTNPENEPAGVPDMLPRGLDMTRECLPVTAYFSGAVLSELSVEQQGSPLLARKSSGHQ